MCSKKDIRVFLDKNDYDKLCNYWRHPDWVGSFVFSTINDFKTNYVDKNVPKPSKGIIKDYEINDFERNSDIRDINIITFRLLNFILYSYLLGSYILDNLSKEEMKLYLVENLFPVSLFGIVKKNWELLDIALKEKGVENIQIFMNMIFEKMNEFICNLKSVDTVDKLSLFEKQVNDYIMGILSNKENIDKLNNDYKAINNELLSFNSNSMKEIILGNYEPSEYDPKFFPDMQYYTVSKLENYDTFVNKFQSIKENENKYTLINLLIKKDEDLCQNAINMKSLENLNKLTNMLLNIYSFNISREDAKNVIFKKEYANIIDKYNEINKNSMINTENEFEKEYVLPFIESWDRIKKKCLQYKCRVLRENEKIRYLDMKPDLPLCFYLIDDGDIDKGMFLASAYQNMIDWQNAVLNLIISKNSMNGVLNSYVSQLEQEINIQEATREDIIKIDDKTYKALEDLISSSSLRNIFGKDNSLHYKNYNDIIYNYDYIEEELGKLILPGLKRFRHGEIKFITYLYEGFRGDDHSSVLTTYNLKYVQKPLSEEEKISLSELTKNNNVKFINEVFASLQILMNEIIKENYNQDVLIYDIIEKLPNYIILNKELVNLLKNKKDYYMNEKVFTINSLISVFEYFEALCWNQIKDEKNILDDYRLLLDEKSKKHVLDYFKKIENEKKIINVRDFTFALRRLISRYLAGARQDIDIKSDLELHLQIVKNEFWSKEIADNDEKDNELAAICIKDIKIGNAFDLYNLLDGDAILSKEIDKNKKKEKEKEKEENIKDKKDDISEFEIITTSSEKKPEDNNPAGDKVPSDDEENVEEEEERDDF